MALTTFGTRPRAPRSVAALAERRARMHELLMKDDWHEWQSEFSLGDKELSRWVRGNIVHIMQACPSVLAGWKTTLPGPLADKMVIQAISVGLDGLDDEDKMRALRGESTTRLARMLGNFVNDDPQNWGWLSPSWVGAPNSPLRAAATAHGWLPGKLLGQVTKALDSPTAPVWTSWLAYPHCMQVLHRQAQVRLQQRQEMVVQPMKKTSACWGNPIDIALAQQLIAQSPKPLFMELTAHDEVPPVLESERLRLQGLVEVHIGLGALEQLHASLLAGVLPGEGMTASMTVELPDLGDIGYECYGSF